MHILFFFHFHSFQMDSKKRFFLQAYIYSISKDCFVGEETVSTNFFIVGANLHKHTISSQQDSFLHHKIIP